MDEKQTAAFEQWWLEIEGYALRAERFNTPEEGAKAAWLACYQHLAPMVEDAERLNAIARESWDLRSFAMTGGLDGDADVGWRVIEHHMQEPCERVVAEVFKDDPRKAIDAAREQEKKTC